MADRSPVGIEAAVSVCLSSLPSCSAIDARRPNTPPPGTIAGSERILVSRFDRYSGSCCASDDISCTTIAAKPSNATKAITTVSVTAATLGKCHRSSRRTTGANKKLKRIASVIGTMTSRAKYKNATTDPTVRQVNTPKKAEEVGEDRRAFGGWSATLIAPFRLCGASIIYHSASTVHAAGARRWAESRLRRTQAANGKWFRADG